MQSNKKKVNKILENMNRRTFIKNSALLGGTLAASGAVNHLLANLPESEATADSLINRAYVHHLPENQLYSVCQQCNTNCGIKVKFRDGRLEKIDGNPYSPWTMTPQIPYETPIQDAATVEGSLCPKGHAGIQTLYDPYRLVKVLKRTGKRGENKWEVIPFEQAVDEVVNGGDLFGEGHVDGLNDIVVLRDRELSRTMASDSAQVARGEMSLDEFKERHKDNLHYLIDPDHPDLGPKNNQLCLNWGRVKNGRGDLMKDFFRQSCGSVNYHGHTTVCQGSLYFTCKAMSEQFIEGEWAGGKKFYWQADTGNAEFIIFVGANPFEANYGPPLRTQKVTEGTVDGRLKIAVIDPRCSKVASRAWKWLPVESNGVGAVAMAMIQWMLANGRIDFKYLQNANKAAARMDNEPTWTQACWLVKIENGQPGSFLRASDIGLPTETRSKKGGGQWEFDPFVTYSMGRATPFDPNSENQPVEGDLYVDTTINNIKVKSVLQIIREEADVKNPDQWASIAGVNRSDIEDLAKEFTSHGKKSVVDMHRGVSQHTNGFYNVLLWMTVNVLIGNHDWQGGSSSYTQYDRSGGRPGKPFQVNERNKNAPVKWGVNCVRHSAEYSKTTLFEGYPAKRTWYPFCSDIYQEVIPSMGDMYPYQIKALFLYMAAPNYALPSGHKVSEIMMDSKKIPLIIASDIVVGETSMYADYIFPDTTYLERWEFPGAHPSVTPKVFPIRQPVAAPLTESVHVFGEEMPLNLESTLMAFAEKMDLDGFGEDAFGPGLHMNREEDLYLRMVANVAFGDAADGSDMVPEASVEEIKIFEESRRHLPDSVFNARRWESVVGSKLWPRVVYILSRGGRFQSYFDAYQNQQKTNKYGKMVGMYFEYMVNTIHSQTGEPYVGHPRFIDGPRDCTGKFINDRADGYDLTLITYKHIAQTKTRTGASNYWLMAVYPENFMEIAAQDAQRMGLKPGDKVRVVSPTNTEGIWDLGFGRKLPMIGKVKIIQGIRPGTIAFSLGHGHWAYGASPITINGRTVQADERRGRGFHANAAMRVDPFLGNTTLSDTVGGSAVFYQSQVRLEKV
ncbi:MAG: molybdopterin-dependent oxidoreductase [Desulfonatronovibrio sp.]|nr:molybdopterin-dependent oxidoreductase [Desulfovibrionales bacterium]